MPSVITALIALVLALQCQGLPLENAGQAPSQAGEASWYGPGYFGQHMSNGDILTTETVGIAHRTLPLGSWVRLTSRYGSTVVQVTDRGPFGYEQRIVDLTPRVADVIMGGQYGYTLDGTPYGMVEVTLNECPTTH